MISSQSNLNEKILSSYFFHRRNEIYLIQPPTYVAMRFTDVCLSDKNSIDKMLVISFTCYMTLIKGLFIQSQ